MLKTVDVTSSANSCLRSAEVPPPFPVVTFRCSIGKQFYNKSHFPELNVSYPTVFLIFLPYRYVEGHMALYDFSITFCQIENTNLHIVYVQ